MLIPVFKPSIRRKEMDAVLSCMVSDNLWPGNIAETFIKEMSLYLGVAGGVALREYPRALEVAVEALSLEPGAKVILSALDPEEYIKILQENGYQPLIVDVKEQNGCIDPSGVEKALAEKPQAMIVSHPLGFVPNLEELSAFGLPIVEDLSSGFGSHTGSRKSGTYGRFTVVRLEPEDMLTAGGGTAVLSAQKRDLGILRKIADQLSPTVKLPDFNAALGLSQLHSLEQYIHRRKELAALYTAALAKGRHKTLVQEGDAENMIYSFPVTFSLGARDAVSYAKKIGIEVIPAFRNRVLDSAPDPLAWKNASSLCQRTLLFPLYPMLGKKNALVVERVLSALP